MTHVGAAYPLRGALAGILLFAVGLAIAAGTYLTYREEQARMNGWLHATGTVVDLVKRRTPTGEVTAPLVAFRTASNERVSFTAAVGAGSPSYYVNTEVPVLYRPAQPQDAVIDMRSRRWTRNALAGGAALLLVSLGGYVAWYASRWESLAAQAKENG